MLALAVGSQAAVRAMRACGAHGHIVNISSSATRPATPGFYGATKTAVNAITASLRQELENDTIRVVTVIPARRRPTSAATSRSWSAAWPPRSARRPRRCREGCSAGGA